MTTNKPEVFRFHCHGQSAPAYSCNKPADNSGEYVRLSDYEARMAVLFDGYAVYNAMTDRAKQHTSPESVAAVLDAVVKLMGEVSNDSQ